MIPNIDILVAGEINPDLILSGDVVPKFGQVEQLVDSAALTIGSSSAIFACGIARLGLKVAFVGVCGTDIFGRFMLDELSKRGVDVSGVIIDPAQPTGLSVILTPRSDEFTGGRAILTHLGALASLRAEQVTQVMLQRARHLHVASYFLQSALQSGLPGLFADAHAAGLTTSLDTNWDPSGEWRNFDELLATVDVFLPNENEALALTRTKSIEAAAKALAQKCGRVAVKLGAQGALACQAGQVVKAKALKLAVVDTIGAGDSFDAGFVYGFLNGWSLEKSLRLGTACGSLSVRLAGGTAAQPTLEQALEYVPAGD